MTQWLRHWLRPVRPRLRLLCLPPAGGAAHLYRPWGTRLPLDVEVLAAELPGHGSRWSEPPVTGMHALLVGLGTELAGLPALPLVVFGHSMGAIVALELCRWLRAHTRDWRPAGLIVAGAESPRSRRIADSLATGPDEDLRTFLADAHGPDSPVLVQEALVELVLPVLRADLVLLAGSPYRHQPPLRCPVRAYSGTKDPFVLPGEVDQWAAESDGDFAVHTFDGGHFFVHDAESEVLAQVQAFLHRCTVRQEV